MARMRSRTPRGTNGPKRPPTYTEDVDEAPKLLEQEPVDIEESHPAGQRDSVQSVPQDKETAPPLFEEEERQS